MPHPRSLAPFLLSATVVASLEGSAPSDLAAAERAVPVPAPAASGLGPPSARRWTPGRLDVAAAGRDRSDERAVLSSLLGPHPARPVPLAGPAPDPAHPGPEAAREFLRDPADVAWRRPLAREARAPRPAPGLGLELGRDAQLGLAIGKRWLDASPLDAEDDARTFYGLGLSVSF
jgi:hypothetical protein